MKTLDEVVRDQIVAEGPQICDDRSRDMYINDVINSLSPVELLERISNAIGPGFVGKRR